MLRTRELLTSGMCQQSGACCRPDPTCFQEKFLRSGTCSCKLGTWVASRSSIFVNHNRLYQLSGLSSSCQLTPCPPLQLGNCWWNTIDLDYCMFGCDYRKSTRILTAQHSIFEEQGNAGLLSRLERRCDRQHQHVTLSGWGPRDGNRRPTRGTARYPSELVALWAQLALEHFTAVKESSCESWSP